MRLCELFENNGGLDRIWLNSAFGKETVGEFFDRHDIPVDAGGMVVLYHGRPKDSRYDTLRSGSYLTTEKKDAVFFAARDRDLGPNDIEILTLHLTPDQIQPGMHITLIGDYKL